jgi:predicted Zn finger-like uncharacterized protein
MEFSCEKCRTRYAVPDEKVRGKRVRTNCRKCGAEIVLQGPAGVPQLPRTPAARPSAASLPRAEERWTVAVSRTEQKKMTTAEIVDGYASGVVSDHTLVWKQGMDGWRQPFEIPAVALGLTARGLVRNAGWREPGKASLPPSRPPPNSIDALATAWDDDGDDEATQIHGALPFVQRMMMPSAPPAPSRPLAPPAPSRPVAPPAPSRPVAPPAPPRPVAPPAPPRPALPRLVAPLSPSVPASAERADAADESLAHTVDTMPPPPGAADFSFEDEATAVIAPDRVRALLDAELAKSPGDTAPSETAPSETPVAFGFEEESTQVTAPDSAPDRLLTEVAKSFRQTLPASPPPAFPAVPTLSSEPSIVVAKPKEPVAEEEKPAAPPKSNVVEPRDIIRAFQNEPTRVVRAVKKKSSARQVWLVVGLALVAAAAGGFIASEILARQHVPSGPRAP